MKQVENTCIPTRKIIKIGVFNPLSKNHERRGNKIYY
jgi:hypothetical protein